nr:alkaline phosphatase 3-like [Nerophis lumbriciformis]
MRRTGCLTGVLLILAGAGVAFWWMHYSPWQLRLERRDGDPPTTRAVQLDPRQRTASDPSQQLERWPEGHEVRNVILLIGDGLGFSQIQAARSDLVGLDGRLLFERMPFTGWLSTHSYSRAVPDSAASATAMATGQKILNRQVAVDPEGRPLRTVLEAARDRGLATGLVTSSYLVDATPASFASHVESRYDYDEIARQLAGSGVDLLLGELRQDLEAAELARRIDRFAAAGYSVHRDWRSLEAADANPVVGLFDPGVIPDPDQSPSLAALTELALRRLTEAREGYFLMIEEEETDTACAELAIAAARADPHTLVLLTADHETGHFGIHRGERGQPLGVRFDSDNHTGVPVPIYAFGAGAEHFTGALDNTDVAWRLAKLLGLELGSPGLAE